MFICFIFHSLVFTTSQFQQNHIFQNHIRQAKSNMYIHLITFFLLTALSIAAPAPQAPTPDPYDNFPWQLTNMVIVESPSNSTRLTFIKFDIQDPNPGLEVNTTCIRTVPGGTDLVSDIHFPCDNKSVGFSYRGSEIWLHHSWRNNVTL